TAKRGDDRRIDPYPHRDDPVAPTLMILPVLPRRLAARLPWPEMHRVFVPYMDQSQFIKPGCAKLTDRRAHLVDHQVDDVGGTLGAERAQAPEKGLAGKRHVGAERARARDIEAGARAGR